MTEVNESRQVLNKCTKLRMTALNCANLIYASLMSASLTI